MDRNCGEEFDGCKGEELQRDRQSPDNPGRSPEMSTTTDKLAESNAQRYGAVLRISEALSACREPEELAKALADQLNDFLSFAHLDILVLKENSREIEWNAWGKGPLSFPELPPEELPAWYVYDTQETLHIADWNRDQRFPRLKQFAAEKGIHVGALVLVPLTTSHRHLGTLGIAGSPGMTYEAQDIEFLRLIARVVAFAVDDGLNLRRAQAAQTRLRQQNDRLQLLLTLTNRITSNLELRELLRAIAPNIRDAMQCDALGISLPDPASGKFRLYALDFPQGQVKHTIQEETLHTLAGSGKRALESLTAVLSTTDDREAFAPEIHQQLVAEGLRNQCVIPLVNRGRALGLLVTARKTDSFAAEEVEFLGQAAGQIAIAVENALAFRAVAEPKEKLAREKLYLEEEIRSERGFEQIVGNSPALKQVLELVETVAPSDSTVLLLGETGTGKELIARAIHEHSRRKDRTFVKLNCAAIPTGLLESELFGHEKGAFTGAIGQKIGRLELADQGTLFLDEVGDIPIEIQPKLLRALQEREFERLGSTHTRKVNVRLIAATNRDLEKMIADRQFRSDLFYRLNVFPIRIPALRDRREDIPLLASHFVQKCARQMQKNIETIPSPVMRGLTAWEWPGNIRELENFVERAVILTRGKSLNAPLAELHRTNYDESTHAGTEPDRADIAEIVRRTISALDQRGKTLAVQWDTKDLSDEYSRKRREEIVRALAESKGRVGGARGAAARMGVNRTTLIFRMKKFGIDPRQYA
jgi:formate hydrogenlyase transcriptional activator